MIRSAREDDVNCPRCGRRMSLTAASVERVRIAAEGCGLDDWPWRDRAEEFYKPIQAGDLERWDGSEYDEALAKLDRGARLGILVRKGLGWMPRDPLCSPCYAQLSTAVEVETRPAIGSQLRFLVLQRDGFRCSYCGRTQQDGAKLHLDHITPVSRGGKTVADNLITACDQCNLGKGTRSVLDE